MMPIDFSSSPSQLLHLARQKADELFSSLLRGEGITSRQFAIMYAIHQVPGLSQKELATTTGSDRSTIAEMVGRLHRAGYINRIRSKRDARIAVLTLSDKGVACVEKALPIGLAVDDALLEPLAPEARGAFVAALRIIAQSKSPDT